MDLNELLVFANVVQAGSFVGAARALDMPKSTVSRKVAELETRLGARLLHRTTRTLHLTDVGRAYYDHARRVVSEAEAAELAVTQLQDVPRGVLRITAPLNFDVLAPAVASFLERHPQVRIEMVCADRVVDLVHEGFDLGIRAGTLADSTLVARMLGKLRNFVVASPGFLEHAGTPKVPEDLAKFDCVVFAAGSDPSRWTLRAANKTVSVEVQGRLVVNDFDMLHHVAVAGLGLAMLPAFRCVNELRSKQLRRVLPDWCSSEIPLQVVYPSARHLSPKVKAFVDHLVEHMTPPPWELGPT